MKNIRTYIILIFINIIFFVFIHFVNYSILDLRKKELNSILQQKNKETIELDHYSIVLNYKLNMQLYRKEISIKQADTLLLNLNLLNRYDRKKEESIPKKNWKYYLSKPSIEMINLIRFIIGKEPIDALHIEKNIPEFEIAYYYERNYMYKDAIDYYDRAINSIKNINRTRYLTGSILLHKGFCHSMVGSFSKARKNYLQVIEKNRSMKIATTASMLLVYLDEFKKERKIVLKEKNFPGKVEKLFYLFAYKDSMKILNKIKNKISKKDKIKFQFIEARCLEELNKKQEAAIKYQKIILNNKRNEYVNSANRRIFIMGEESKQNAFLSDIALKNNIMVKDPVLQEIIVNKIKLVKKNNKNKTSLTTRVQNNIKNEENISQILVENVGIENKKIYNKNEKDEGIYRFTFIKGDIFLGKLVKDEGEYIYIETSFGIVKIKKVDIQKKELVKQGKLRTF